jgi:hypothetical protein
MTPEDAERLAADPDSWDALPDDDLVEVLLSQCMKYGFTADEQRIVPLARLYRYARNRLPRRDRLTILQLVTDMVVKYPHAHNALNPFAYHDDDRVVSSTALLNYAVLMPLVDNDPMTGPKYLMGQAILNEDQSLRVVILSALLMLGDRRVMDIIDGSWRLLDQDGRLQLSNAHSGFLSAGEIEFILRWLESLDDIAAALARKTTESVDGKVRDIVRAFPANAPDAGDAVSVVQEWTVPKFGRLIEPRLRAIYEREHEPHVLDTVMGYWDIQVRQPRRWGRRSPRS